MENLYQIVSAIAEKRKLIDDYRREFKEEPKPELRQVHDETVLQYQAMLRDYRVQIRQYAATIKEPEFPCSSISNLFIFSVISKRGGYEGQLLIEEGSLSTLDYLLTAERLRLYYRVVPGPENFQQAQPAPPAPAPALEPPPAALVIQPAEVPPVLQLAAVPPVLQPAAVPPVLQPEEAQPVIQPEPQFPPPGPPPESPMSLARRRRREWKQNLDSHGARTPE